MRFTGGDIQLTETLQLTAAGTAADPILVTADSGTRLVVSGAEELSTVGLSVSSTNWITLES